MKRIFMATLLVACCIGGHASAADKIKLGFIASLSGPLGISGAEVQRGLTLALSELGNKIGGLPVEVVIVDDKGNPSEGVKAASKLIDQDKVDVVTGLINSGVLLATNRSFAAAKIPMIGALAGPSQLAGKDCTPYFFALSFQNDMWDEAMGLYMNKQNYKRVYFMGMDYQAGWDHVGGAVRTFKGTVAAKVFTPLNQLDFAPEFAQLRAANPDAVYVFYVGSPGIAFIKQYAQAGLKGKIPLLAQDGFADALILPAVGDAALGITVAASWSPSLDNPLNKKFVDAFKAKYGRVPNTFAAFQYDAVKLLDSAVKAVKGKIEDKEALLAAIKKADFQSIRGPFKFNNNHFPIQNIYLETVEKGPDGKPALMVKSTIASNFEDSYHQQCPMK